MYARFACANPGILVGGGGGGGGPGQSDKKRKSSDNFFFFFFFFSPQLILQKSNGQFQRNLSFFKVPEGVQHFPGGVQLFLGGSNCLFPIETHITCDFPGGVRTPCSPPWIRTWFVLKGIEAVGITYYTMLAPKKVV